MLFKRYAVIPTRGDRIGTLRVAIGAIAPQVDAILMVDNSDDCSTQTRLIELCGAPEVAMVSTYADPQQPPNLSALWNHGLNQVAIWAAGEPYRVAVLNDDAIVSQAWFEVVSFHMDKEGAAAGGFGGGRAVTHRTPGQTPLDQRMPGYAFILDGSKDLRADERFHWWCGDNDLDMQARAAGGTVILAGDPVRHLFPDQSTGANPVLQGRTHEDMRLFVEKWGFRPW